MLLFHPRTASVPSVPQMKPPRELPERGGGNRLACSAVRKEHSVSTKTRPAPKEPEKAPELPQVVTMNLHGGEREIRTLEGCYSLHP